MFHWIESIALEHGVLKNLRYHQKRLDRTLEYFGGTSISLNKVLNGVVLPVLGYYKVRVLYSVAGVLDISVDNYLPKCFKTFEMVEATDIDYSFKYANRDVLVNLKRCCTADEIIITQNGLITDTTFSNLIFLRGGEWYTPTSVLLKGTQRALLLEQDKIKEAIISVDNIASFTHFKLINAMLSIDNSPVYSVNQIR